MINKAHFFRDVKNLESLVEMTHKAVDSEERNSRFYIQDKINLTDDKFKTFTENFNKTYDFISPYRMILDMSKDYEYICISVSSGESNIEVLVNTSGYSYARNTAVINKV
jgi:hypothetical protein